MHNVDRRCAATTGAANCGLFADNSIYTPPKCWKRENIKLQVSWLRNGKRGEGQNKLN